MAVRETLRRYHPDLTHWEIEDLSRGFDLDVHTFAEWVDARQEERTLVDAPKQSKAKVPVPLYNDVWELLGIDADFDEDATSDVEAEEIAKALRTSRDPDAINRFLRGDMPLL